MRLHYLSYRLLTILLSPLLFGHIAWLAIKNKNARYFWQRLGFRYSQLPRYSLWFHCASVGEVNTVLPLLKHLYEKNPQLKILITTNTITGARIVEQQQLDYLFHSYLPFDWRSTVGRFLSRLKPLSLHIVETEIWPTLFTVCRQKNIATDIINARLSKKTTEANSWVRALLADSLHMVDAIYARSEANADAYRQLGAPAEKITTVGNLKFTTLLRDVDKTTDSDLVIDRDYVLLASTHEDEELQVYNRWKELHRDELLVIAPRHPERADAIIKQLGCDQLAVRRTTQNGYSGKLDEYSQVFILNTVGELGSFFSRAKIVIMGGSFIAVGGHNILEPASFNKAIITGPHMDNFEEELALMKSRQAILQTDSYEQMMQLMEILLQDENDRHLLEHNTEKLTHDVEDILHNYAQRILPD